LLGKLLPLKRLLGLRSNLVATLLGSSTDREVRPEPSPLHPTCWCSADTENHRTLALATFTFSVLVYTGAFPYHYFPFIPRSFLQLPPELWRLVTPFFITGPGLSIFFETYFCERIILSK
jgi:hypothetical protein